MQKPQRNKNLEVIRVGRKRGGLRKIETSGGGRYLVLKREGTEHLLREGYVLDEDDMRMLRTDLAAEAGMRFAVEKLRRRDRSEGEIRSYLRQEGVENEDVINYIIETLKEHRYLDDRAFARNYVEYRMKHRPTGPGAIKKKLRAAGVGGEIIDEALESFFAGGREGELAEEMVRNRFSPSGDLRRLVGRANGFLRRRGFSSEVTNSICSRILRKGFFNNRHE